MNEYDEYYNLIDADIYRQAMPNIVQSNFPLQEQIMQQQEAFPQDIQNTLGLFNFNNNFTNLNQNCGMFNPREGFIRGNMFPNLFDPYKKQQLRNISPMNEKERMMLEIQQLDFAIKDINLYLDVHPNDRCMIRKFNEYLNTKERLLDEYQNRFGPIALNVPNKSLEKNPWSWLETKSPWKGGK